MGQQFTKEHPHGGGDPGIAIVCWIFSPIIIVCLTLAMFGSIVRDGLELLRRHLRYSVFVMILVVWTMYRYGIEHYYSYIFRYPSNVEMLYVMIIVAITTMSIVYGKTVLLHWHHLWTYDNCAYTHDDPNQVCPNPNCRHQTSTCVICTPNKPASS